MDSLGDQKTRAGGNGRHAYALAAGETFGQYRIIKTLGAGGMGEVYEAEHVVLHRRYALKLLHAEVTSQPGALERFRKEAEVMANLDHPNILRVDEFGETGGRYWLRMELANGIALSGTCAVTLAQLAVSGGGRLPQAKVLEIIYQILDGMHYAHGRGVVHRDLKPSNILILSRDGKTSFTISDFGLVRLTGEQWIRGRAQESVRRSLSMGDRLTEAAAESSGTRSLLGTYEYMSPEQKRGEEATPRSDLYAVGLMAFRLLTGRDPGLKPPSQIDPGLCKAWDAFTVKALEEEPSERMASAAEGIALLEKVAIELSVCPPVAEKPRRETVEIGKGIRTKTGGPWASGRWLLAGAAAVMVAVSEWKYWEYGRQETETSRQNETVGQSARTDELRIARKKADAKSERIAKEIRTVKGPVAGETWASPATGMEFVWVPTLKLWVGKYEVTNAEYRKQTPDHDSKDYNGQSLNGDRQPVVYVNFDDAKAYAEWLTGQDRERLGGLRYRVICEQEWQTVAQCGDGREYPWGNAMPPKHGNYSDSASPLEGKIAGYTDGFAVACPVELSGANEWGVYGLGGNVWECCASDASGSAFGAWRGASWGDYSPGFLRCAFRRGSGGSLRVLSSGLRLALSR